MRIKPTGESYWKGMDEVTSQRRCHHGKRLRKKVAWGGPSHGRRFLGCYLEEEDEDQCDTVHWVDPRWPGKVRKLLKQWTKEHQTAMASLHECSKTCKRYQQYCLKAWAERDATIQLQNICKECSRTCKEKNEHGHSSKK